MQGDEGKHAWESRKESEMNSLISFPIVFWYIKLSLGWVVVWLTPICIFIILNTYINHMYIHILLNVILN